MKFIEKVTVSTLTLADLLEYNDTPVLKYNIEYPKFTPADNLPAVRRMNLFYEKAAYDYARYLRRVMFRSAVNNYEYSVKNDYPFHMYEAMLTYTPAYNQNCALSLYADRYEYTGGAHGNTLRSSQTWSLRTGGQISLKELFPGNPHYIADLKAEIISQIDERIAAGDDMYYFEEYRKLVEETFDPKNFYLTPGALVIYFQQYDIAPYSSGLPEFHIPYGRVNAKVPDCNQRQNTPLRKY